MKSFFYFLYICLSTKAFSQEKLVKVNGINFNVYTKGLESRKANSPVLVFENGMGVGLGSWDTVLDELSKAAPVVAYDRANVEKSDRVYQLPTIKHVAANLKGILNTLNVLPPYVLVGHSMGGLYARGFAGLYQRRLLDWFLLTRQILLRQKKTGTRYFVQLVLPNSGSMKCCTTAFTHRQK